MMLVSHPTLITAPASLPVTLDQAKRQVEVASDDASHDAYIESLIQVAVDQFETDCDHCLVSRKYFVNMGKWPRIIELPKRPVLSVDLIQYYDDGNSLQTLSTSVYSANLASRSIELKNDQVWPSAKDRWNSIRVEYTCGYANIAAIPAAAKHAILMLVGYYFGQNRGDNDRASDMAAYKRLVSQFIRIDYP